MHPVQMMCPCFVPVHFVSLCLASISSLNVNTMATDIFVSWETSLPYIKLFEISQSINGDTTSVMTTDQAMLELKDLNPSTNVWISIQPITSCGPVGSAIR